LPPKSEAVVAAIGTKIENLPSDRNTGLGSRLLRRRLVNEGTAGVILAANDQGKAKAGRLMLAPGGRDLPHYQPKTCSTCRKARLGIPTS